MKRIFLQVFVLWLTCCSYVYGKDAVALTHHQHNNNQHNNNIVHRKQTATSHPFEEPPATGNFAIRVSQQPAPFIAFGQNIINKHQFQLYLFGDYLHGSNQHYTDALPYAVYGLTDASSLLVSVPIAVNYRAGGYSSQGFGNATVQFEHAFYTTSTKKYEDQATFVLAAMLPTASTSSQPATGSEAFSYFAGMTYNRTYNDWLGFVSPGFNVPATHNGNRAGTQYVYQAGIGRNIASVTSKWLLTWMVEADGLFVTKSRSDGFMNQDSGANTIFITPSLFYGRNNAIFQVGFGIPCLKQLNGDQTINGFFVGANAGWTF